jgi:hypothetical protein
MFGSKGIHSHSADPRLALWSGSGACVSTRQGRLSDRPTHAQLVPVIKRSGKNNISTAEAAAFQ